MAKQKLGPLQRKGIARLRSGRYAQTKGALHRVRAGKHSFCCLGIACELLQIPGQSVGGKVGYSDSKEWKVMPGSSWRKLKLRQDTGDSKDHECSLVEMNDGGKSFAQIADIVTADPSIYFTGPI